jgi:hypothetical protein
VGHRSSPIPPGQYWTLTIAQPADLIWKALFVEHNPISEATRGGTAVLQELGLDTSAGTLTRVFRLAGIESVVMTNDPLDPEESPLWDSVTPDPRFHAALRLDRLLNQETDHTPAEARCFVERWATRMRAVYMAVSLPDSFQFPVNDRRNQLLLEAVLPACRELNIPLSLMIGVRAR